MFAFGLYTQVSNSGPHGPLVKVNHVLNLGSIIEYGKLKKNRENSGKSQELSGELERGLMFLLLVSDPFMFSLNKICLI